MSPSRASLFAAFAVILCGLAANPSRADEPHALASALPRTTVTSDIGRDAYARFSDGPRSVPRPRGAALARAEALGLGTRSAATHLLTRSPEARWMEAARGRRHRTLLWPVEGARFGRGFGFTRRERRELRHEGIDVAAPAGAEVHAVADGIVAYADNGVRGFGNCVILVHANGWVSLYAHLARATVQPGWRAVRGERIGLVGSTGIARGPHLHFELRMNGRTRDPEPLFAAIPFRAPHRRSDLTRTVARSRCERDTTSGTCAVPR